MGQALKTFDGLPFHDAAATQSSKWLPSDLKMLATRLPLKGGEAILSSLKESLQAESAALHALDEQPELDDSCCAAEIEIQDAGEGLRSVVWHNAERTAISSQRHSGVFELTEARLDWLRSQHAQVELGRHVDATVLAAGTEALESTFRQRLFQLLARYDGMGGGTHGAGNQAAVPPEVFEAFEGWASEPLGSCVECFASPLNHRSIAVAPSTAHGSARKKKSRGARHRPAATRPLAEGPARFYSAFADVDTPFGSLGSFLAQQGPPPPTGGHTLLLLNPPFFPRHMEAIAPTLARFFSAIRASLPAETASSAAAADTPPPSPRRITALVVVPAVGDGRSEEVPHLNALETSPFIVAHRTLAPNEHSFCQGAAYKRTRGLHLRHLSRFPTMLYVLSSSAQPPSTKHTWTDLMDAVQAAFLARSHFHRAGRNPKDRRRRTRRSSSKSVTTR